MPYKRTNVKFPNLIDHKANTLHNTATHESKSRLEQHLTQWIKTYCELVAMWNMIALNWFSWVVSKWTLSFLPRRNETPLSVSQAAVTIKTKRKRLHLVASTTHIRSNSDSVLAFWVGNYSWTRPENLALECYYARANLFDCFNFLEDVSPANVLVFPQADNPLAVNTNVHMTFSGRCLSLAEVEKISRRFRECVVSGAGLL